MPTTASGTAYTVYSANLGAPHGVVYWAVADAAAGNSNIPTVLYAHGAGGADNQLATLAAWSLLRDWLIDNGWAWVEGSGGSASGSQNWGNLASRAAYVAYLDHVDGILDIGKKVLLGRSMGGLVTAWLYAKSGLAFDGWINNSGVSTWFTGDDTNVGSVPSIQRSTRTYFTESVVCNAWGVANRAALSTALVAADAAPEAWAASVWDGKHILCSYGTDDTTVPWYPRGAETLRTLWSGRPAVDLVSAVDGGTHSPPGAYADIEAMSSFLYDIGGGEEPTPHVPTLYRVRNSYLIVDGERHRTGPRPRTIIV